MKYLALFHKRGGFYRRAYLLLLTKSTQLLPWHGRRTLTVAILVICSFGVKKSADLSVYGSSPVFAQTASTTYQVVGASDVWRQVYQQLPNLPLENQYVSQETGKVDTNSTLISRLIRYHIYVKGRPSIYRLDWKLTLADYLGANETMDEGRYPGSDTLRKNPLDGDRAAIGRLNLAQRDALVQVLVKIFNPKYQDQSASTDDNSTASQPQATPKPVASHATYYNGGNPKSAVAPHPTLTQPRPGDAHLLAP